MTAPSHLEWAILASLLERVPTWQIPANFSALIFQMLYLIQKYLGLCGDF